MGRANPFPRPQVPTHVDVARAVAMAQREYPGGELVIHASRVVFADLAKGGVLIRKASGGHFAFNYPVQLHAEWAGYICEVRPDE